MSPPPSPPLESYGDEELFDRVIGFLHQGNLMNLAADGENLASATIRPGEYVSAAFSGCDRANRLVPTVEPTTPCDHIPVKRRSGILARRLIGTGRMT